MLPKRRFCARVAGLLAGLVGIAGTGITPAQSATLTGMVAFSANSAGRVVLGPIYNTIGGDIVPNLYVGAGSPGGSFLNSGNGASTGLSLALTPGTHTFTLYGDKLPFVPSYVGLNLFFDGQTIPGISVFAPIKSTSFAADGNSRTPRLTSVPPLTGLLTPGAGTLTYDDVTLTAFSFKSPHASHVDRVSLFSLGADCDDDFKGTLTLNVAPVAPVPVPAALPLMASALGLPGFVALRKRRS